MNYASFLQTLAVCCALVSVATPAFATTFKVTEPTDGASVQWPLRVKGQAPIGVKLRFRVNDELLHTIDATTSTTFDVTLKLANPPKQVKLAVAMISPSGEILLNVLNLATVAKAVEKPKPVVVPKTNPSPQKTPTKPTPQPKPAEQPKAIERPVEAPKAKPTPTEKTVPIKPLEPIKKTPPVALSSKPGFGNRLVSELFLGSLIGAGGGVLGGLVAWQVSNQAFGDEAPIKTFAIISGAYLGTATLLPLGVYTGGRAAGGEGSLLMTLGFGLAATGGAMAFALDNDTSTGAALTTLALAPVLGSLLGYELSHAIFKGDDISPTPRKKPSDQVRWFVMPTSDGFGMGAVGRF